MRRSGTSARRFPTLCALKASLTCSALLLDCLGESLGAALSALDTGQFPERTIHGSESTAQPFEAELDRYVESVVLSQAAALGDAAALAAWMEQEAAGWRKSVAIARCWMRKPADQAPREIAPLGSYDRAVQSRMLELDLARANLLEQLAGEVHEARAPKTQH